MLHTGHEYMFGFDTFGVGVPLKKNKLIPDETSSGFEVSLQPLYVGYWMNKVWLFFNCCANSELSLRLNP
jgi:hypothetical protein